MRMLPLGGKVLRSQHDAPAAGLSFSADGKLLAAALASVNLVVYDVEAARPTQVRVKEAARPT